MCVAGDIDPAIIPYLCSHGMTVKDVDNLMNKKSGFLGLAGASRLGPCFYVCLNREGGGFLNLKSGSLGLAFGGAWVQCSLLLLR